MKYLRFLVLIALFFQVTSSAETQATVNQNKFTKNLSDIYGREDGNLGTDDEYVSTKTL